MKRKKKRINGITIGGLFLLLAIVSFSTSKYITESVYATGFNVEGSLETNKDIIANEEEKNEKDKREEDASSGESNVENINKITYLSLENDINATDAKEVESRLVSWNYMRNDEKKIAYLTFDDGPSTTVTPKILEVLKNNDIKATFFVIGSIVESDDGAKEVLKQMVMNGHAIGNHGYSHDYKILYPHGTVSPEAFMTDIKKSENVLKSVLGDEFHTRVLRFPGGHGSWKTSGIDPLLEQEGYTFIDWNTLNGDAEGSQNRSRGELLARTKSTVNDLTGNNDVIVVLMHDKYGKETTAESLQETIDYLKSQGYEFKTLK